MVMERWDPFREMMSLRDAMDRLLAESFVWPSRPRAFGGRGTFPVDVVDRDDHFEVRAELPGIKPEDVEVTIRQNVLTIRGESRTQEERREERWVIHERQAGTIERTLTLPMPINAETSEARYEDGVMVLTLPKAEEARPRRITVQGASRLQGAGAAGAMTPGAATTAATAGFGRAQVRESMHVVGSDADDVGTVKEVRDGDFLVDRAMQRDAYVPYSAIKTIDGDRIMLDVPASQVDSMGWPSSSLTGTTPTAPSS
jgi:HSP20 family protein